MKVLAIGKNAEKIAVKFFGEEIEITSLAEDIGNPSKKFRGRFDVVFAFNALQRIPNNAVIGTLKNWNRCLKQGGKLHVFVPSLEWAAAQIVFAEKPSPLLLRHIYGAQFDESEYYLSGHTMRRLRIDLEKSHFAVERAEVQFYQDGEHSAEMHYIVGRKEAVKFENKMLLIEPKKIKPLLAQDQLGTGWNYVLDYAWIVEQVVAHGGEIVLDVGCLNSRLGKYLIDQYDLVVDGVDRENTPNATYKGDFMDIDFDIVPDIIVWASSIEHNSPTDIKAMYQKSMDLLPKGGMFLATFAVSPKTHWFELAKQTNLSIEDALQIFEEKKMEGDYRKIKRQYRENVHDLRTRYYQRFRKFKAGDPEYIVGAVRKIKK